MQAGVNHAIVVTVVASAQTRVLFVVLTANTAAAAPAAADVNAALAGGDCN